METSSLDKSSYTFFLIVTAEIVYNNGLVIRVWPHFVDGSAESITIFSFVELLLVRLDLCKVVFSLRSLVLGLS